MFQQILLLEVHARMFLRGVLDHFGADVYTSVIFRFKIIIEIALTVSLRARVFTSERYSGEFETY